MPSNTIIGTHLPDEYDFQMLYLSSLIRETLRVFYADTSETRVPALRHIRWAPDNHTDGGENEPNTIVIDDVDDWNPTRVGSRPAIYVRLNDYTYMKYALGGNQHISPGVTDPTGKELFTKGIAGSITIFCLSELPKECRMLSIDVSRNLQHFGKSIRRKLRLNAFEITKVQAPRELREKPTHLASLVTLEFGLYESWNLIQIAPVLADIQIRSAGTGPNY